MGAEQSNTKSSLLKNYQYLTHGDPRNAKLMYFDYLNFLKYEIEHKAWNWEIYKNYVDKGSTDEKKLFCGWKKIHEKIFEKLEKQQKGQGQNTYKWKDHGEPLIDIKGKTVLSSENCDSINVDFSKISELEDNGSSGKKITSSTTCNSLKTSKDIHVPLRRRALLVKGIDDYLEYIKSEIRSGKALKEVIQTKVDPKFYMGNVAIGLTKVMIEGLSNEFSNIIKEKYEGTEHDAFCKEWYLTMEDYHTLLQGKDIVEENETNKIQCLIDQIEANLGHKDTFKREWSSHFKELVEEKQKKHFIHPTTQRPCNIDKSEKTQCIRFFEEWAEEFCLLKRYLGNMMVQNCKGNPGNVDKKECTGVCNIYKKILEESKPYFENYKNICAQQKYGFTGQDQNELRQNFINAAMNYMTDCCIELGHCSPEELFNIKNEKGNLIYNCMCQGGTHTSQRDRKNECQPYLKDTVQGLSVPAPALSSASLSSSSAACGANKSGNVTKVETIANSIHSSIKDQATKNGKDGTDGKGELRAELSKAEFKDGKKGRDVGDVCNLKKDEHTNDGREYDASPTPGAGKHQGPCTGKGIPDKDRLKIGRKWAPNTEVKAGHTGVLFPPRRLDMCTSTLENLDVDQSEGFKDGDKAKHSLLGDVMLAAKTEAEKIIELYTDKKDNESICRSMKASFADIGDIIRGRDIWTQNREMKQLEEKLVTIFGKIKGKVPRGTNYDDDSSPYPILRREWWELNREQIWKAMLCAKDGTNKIQCDTSGGPSRGLRGTSTPLDDYIPQKLRWLTEWSEWYCKTQKKHYNDLVGVCNECKTNNKTGQTCDPAKCEACKKKCEAYKTEVQKWETDWKTQKQQYQDFYTKAKNPSTSSSGTVDENQKYLDEFLKKLQQANTNNDPYSTAEGYIQQELKNGNVCEKQTKFCGNSGDKDNVFRDKPHDYDVACGCDSKTPCDVVNTILKNKDTSKGKIDDCNKKEGTTWNCDQSKFIGGVGPCMPPRRVKMCLYYLTKTDINDEKKLKEAFIKTGAAETNLLWDKYKEDKQKEKSPPKQDELDNKLKTGEIPDEFKRQMMYTFADLRDLCLDKDISIKNESTNRDVTIATKKITEVLKNGKTGGTEPTETTRKQFWEKIEKDLWEGMLCALSYDTQGKKMKTNVKEKLEEQNNGYDKVKFGDGPSGTKLSDFVKKPQFLRWLTEWGEDFCKRHKVEYDTLDKKCKGCNATSGNNPTCDKHGHECTQCQAQCGIYKTFITQWKGNYDKQKEKYKRKKNDYKSIDSDVKNAEEAHDYINKQMQKICQNSGNNSIECDCMEKPSSQSSSSGNDKMPQTLDEYPNDDYKNKCTCDPKPPQKPKCTGNKILDAANIKQYEAEKQVHDNGVRDKLRGDLSKAKFKHSKPTPLKSDGYCDFDLKKHGNDVRHYRDDPNTTESEYHHGPCTGKGKGTNPGDQRFIIGDKWTEGGSQMRDNHSDVLLPPRRKHMCTSNLENLGSQSVEPLKDVDPTKYNHSFLGDVLLAAKFEGEDIVHKLSSKSDIPGICNAMKYSFADLGDIIRGKDLWSKNVDMTRLEQHLQAIFGRIQTQLPDGNKYKSDKPPYTTLREAWWNANRDQVWKALTCSAPTTADIYVPSSDTTNKRFERVSCGRESYVPPDDYIPQRLRWMTEWSESYCKQLERNFWWVKAFCHACKKAKDKKKENTAVCERCVKNCQVYTDHVKNWKDQWTEQQRQYEQLYSGSTTANDEIKKEHENFLKTVKENNKKLCDGAKTDTNTYPNLSDYVTSMGGSTYCNDTTQKKFEKDTNSNDTESVFRQHPNKYDKECVEDKTQKTPGQPKGPKKPDPSLKAPCDIVKEILDKKDANNPIDSCNPKLYNNQSYPEWGCQGKVVDNEKGACMPPRRQKLCIHDLTTLNGTEQKDKLREAFIKTAAKETFFSWHYYKSKNGGTNGGTEFDEELKKGNIPPDFLRSMFFTYGDYRDLCLGKDIGNDDTKKIGQMVKKILNNGQTPEDWWDDNGLDIWKGMLCGLSHAIKNQSEQIQVQNTLTTKKEYQYDSDNLNFGITNYILYAHTIPQFLRWFTEWSDEFCIEKAKKYVELYTACIKCKINASSSSSGKKCNDCDDCRKQCQAYSQFINEWKGYYNSQKEKFDREKRDDTYQYVPLVDDENTHAYEYLYQSLELLGLHGNCMQHKSTQSGGTTGGSTTGVDMPQALDQYPPDKDEYDKKCSCQEDTTNSGQHVPGGIPDTSGSRILPPAPGGPDASPNPNPSHPGGPPSGKTQTTKCEIKQYIEENERIINSATGGGCNVKKFENKNWDCTNNSVDTTKYDGACMSPRRQSLCIHNLTKLTDSSTKEQLREALIQCASLETHLLWEKYKEDNSGAEKKLKQEGIIPDDFKRMMMYTFGDFKDLCLGKDLGIHTGNNDIKKKVKEILKSANSQDNSVPKEPEQWWTSIEKEVWEAMVCSLTHRSIGGSTDITTKDDYKYDQVKFDTTGTNLTTFVKRPQFLRWMTEWYDDYCQKKHTKLEAVKDTCKKVGDRDFQCDNKNCKTKCKAYTEFMKGKQTEWGKQDKYYKEQKATTGTTGYDDNDAKTYLEKNFTVTCGDKSKSGADVQANISALTQTSPQPNYDVDVYCGCKKYINDAEYKTITNKNNCDGLQNKVNVTPGIEWDSAEGGYKYLKTSGLSENVFIPPRRKHICFKDIDESNVVKDQNSLQKQLLKDAATEGYNLGQYYKEKDENKNDEKYKYDVEACNAFKYSFFDLRDIILGTDNLEPPDKGTETNLKNIFGNGNTSNGAPGSDYRRNWWKSNEKCVWEAMKCGYKRGGDNTTISGCDQPSDKDFPLGDDRAHGTSYQFLRWFAEWGEDYCGHHAREYKKLEDACRSCTVTSGKVSCTPQGECDKCRNACQTYQKFIKTWRPQYVNQSKKYTQDKSESKYTTHPVANSANTARDYLNETLKKSCQNSGTNSGCNCMDKPSKQKPPTNIPQSLEERPDSVKDKCECTNNVVPKPGPPSPQPGAPHPQPHQPPIDPASSGTGTKPGQDPSQPGSSSGTNSDPNQTHTNPNSGDPNNPGTPVVPGGGDPGKAGGSATPDTVEPVNCVEKAAKTLKDEAQKSVDSKLKGSENHNVYTTKQKDDWDNSNICTITPTAGQNDICKNNGNPFDKNEEWDCKKETNKLTIENMCLPPRRKHMCLTPLENIDTSTTTSATSDALFKEVLRTAANEGKHLKEKWDKASDPKMKTQICDAMKYSFADIGDIIRGTDKYKGDNGNNNQIEEKLKTIFGKIKEQVGGNTYASGATESPPYKTLREHWWNTNRKEIWQAMTCSVPRDANIFIKKQQNGTNTEVQYYCGHKSDPPVDDFIPQVFRWINEWSQAYCNAQNSMLETMKNCENCKNETNVGCKQKVHGSCKECKEKCDKYKDFVDKWKTQYDILKKSYENIYQNGTTTGKKPNSVDENTKKFVEKLQKNCQNIQNTQQTQQTQQTQPPDTLDKYLDKGNNCKKFTFDEKTSNGKNYAFETPPNFFKDHCGCAQKFEEVDQCPVEKNHCDEYGKNGTYRCPSKSFNRNPTEWNNRFVKRNVNKYEFVMVPPRRKKLCLRGTRIFVRKIKDEKTFKKYLLYDAYNEAKMLNQYYKSNNDKALQAMKYSFADIGNIVKGDDMYEDGISDKIKEIFDTKINKDKSGSETISRDKWWEENKHKVWNVMMCHYEGTDKTTSTCPSHNNIDNEDQFIRWFTEWGENFCKWRKELYEKVTRSCQSASCDTKEGKIKPENCKKDCEEYKNYVLLKKEEYEKQKEKYKDFKSSQHNRSAHNFLKYNCNKDECDCLSDKFNSDEKWKEPYETFDDSGLKDKCECQKSSTATNPAGKSSNTKDFWKDIVEPLLNLAKDSAKLGVTATTATIDIAKDIIPDAVEAGLKAGIPIAKAAGNKVLDGINTILDATNPKSAKPGPVGPDAGTGGGNPSPTTPQITPAGDILTSTLPPVGISFVLGAIALLFYYMKKKPQLGPTKLFRVIDIPQNDYGIPDKTSTNRYIPYGKYKGKTYIYVERDGDSEDDKYMFTPDTTDVTSSESEYDELDINDIYPYKSPKYKTLIEVVLKPSSKTTYDDTYKDNIMDTSDTPINKLTDDEWNQLKHDFISQYLENIPKDLHNENIIDDKIYMDTQPNIVDSSMEEKPFITSIEDRKLYSNSDITYNIDWNIPKNINRTTNNMNDPKYVTSNDKYSGIDLINDSLNSGNDIDIYDELLKRKENELYGTKYTKKTNSNIFAKQIYDNPILNQLDLYDKWLDRHRDMFNHWNNKEEMLCKLNEEWNMEHNEHVLDIPLNDDDINRINDENYNNINENTQINHEDNDKTSLEHLGSTNIPPNDITRNNNGFRTNNLRTNISMDILMDENNDITNEDDDQLENMYNF